MPDLDQLLGISEWQRLEQDGVNDAEDGSVRADAEGHDEDRNQGESRTLAKHAHGEPNIAPGSFQPRGSPRFPALIPNLFKPSKLDASFTPRLFFCQAPPHVVGGLMLQVKRELLFEFRFELPLMQQTSKPFHGAPPPCSSRTSRTASASSL